MSTARKLRRSGPHVEVRAPLERPALIHAGLIPVLSIVYGLGTALFLALEPNQAWVLLLTAGLVALGCDGIMRSYPGAHFRDVTDSAPYLVLPVLLALGSSLFLEETATGYWIWAAAAAAALLMAGVLFSQYVSVNPLAPAYPAARLYLIVVTYLTAFAFYAVVYNYSVDLLPAAFAVGLASTLLAVELLREAEVDPWRVLVYGATIGLVVAQARWALHFLPLEGFLAAVFLMLGFYVCTGIIHHHLTSRLTWREVAEFAAVTLIGLLVIVIGRIVGGG